MDDNFQPMGQPPADIKQRLKKIKQTAATLGKPNNTVLAALKNKIDEISRRLQEYQRNKENTSSIINEIAEKTRRVVATVEQIVQITDEYQEASKESNQLSGVTDESVNALGESIGQMTTDLSEKLREILENLNKISEDDENQGPNQNQGLQGFNQNQGLQGFNQNQGLQGLNQNQGMADNIIDNMRDLNIDPNEPYEQLRDKIVDKIRNSADFKQLWINFNPTEQDYAKFLNVNRYLGENTVAYLKKFADNEQMRQGQGQGQQGGKRKTHKHGNKRGGYAYSSSVTTTHKRSNKNKHRGATKHHSSKHHSSKHHSSKHHRKHSKRTRTTKTTTNL